MTGVVVFLGLGAFFALLLLADIFGAYAKRRKGRKQW
jgi:cbb3-type cytochrome oxidase subunit 3